MLGYGYARVFHENSRRCARTWCGMKRGNKLIESEVCSRKLKRVRVFHSFEMAAGHLMSWFLSCRLGGSE